MKRVLLLLAVLYAALSMFSFSGGFGNPATGAPGESGATCGQSGCHSAGAFDVDLNIQLLDSEGMAVEEYVPEETYTVSLKINHSGLPEGYGFQMVCLNNDENLAINNFSEFPDGVRERMRLERQYVEHMRRLPVDSIPLTWTAPAKETGAVTFYASGNAVNGNGSPTGDGALSSSFSFAEAMESSTKELADLKLAVFPNPTQDFIRIPQEIEVKQVTILDLQGRVHRSSSSNRLNLSALSSGTYLIKVISAEGQQFSERIQKI